MQTQRLTLFRQDKDIFVSFGGKDWRTVADSKNVSLETTAEHLFARILSGTFKIDFRVFVKIVFYRYELLCSA